jgi:lipopolysaccharide biosynthesis regulator YciM
MGCGSTHYIEHLQSTPSLMAAQRWLDREKLAGDSHQPVIDKALQHAIKPLGRYRCAACGFEAQSHYWQCPGCHNWDSYPPRRIEEL